MNRKTLNALTKALDVAIATVAEERFENLIKGLSEQEIAIRIHDALRALRKLRDRKMPDYHDPWVALFYSLWYQPAHVNLAYTLCRQLLLDDGDFGRSDGHLQVFDFGCGELAMQFGLGLAIADTLRQPPQVDVVSKDDSEPMKSIGWDIWHCFKEESANYDEIDGLRATFDTLNFGLKKNPKATLWLTALHVAYNESDHRVKIQQGLNDLVKTLDPSVILITTHPSNAQAAYSPDPSAYNSLEITLDSSCYKLDGIFWKASALRRKFYLERIKAVTDLPEEYDWGFVRSYLTRHDTEWITSPDFDSLCVFHTRR